MLWINLSMASISRSWESKAGNEWQIKIAAYRRRWFLPFGISYKGGSISKTLDVGFLCFLFHVSRFKGWSPYSKSAGHIV